MPDEDLDKPGRDILYLKKSMRRKSIIIKTHSYKK